MSLRSVECAKTCCVIAVLFFHAVKTIVKDERRYYEDLLKYSREHLMLYPYHLSDVIVKGLRITPFSYYVTIMADIMTQEKSYDSLPNFTAADCKLFKGSFSSLSQFHCHGLLELCWLSCVCCL